MHSDEFLFDLNPYNTKMWLITKDRKGNQVPAKEPRIIQTMFTLTMVLIYLPLIILTVFVFFTNCV